VLKTDKERIVEELAADLGSAQTLIVADYRGLTNKQLEALRDELIPHGARFRIVKNTLTRRAAEQAGAEQLLVMLEGPTAIAFIEADGDMVGVAKALSDAARTTRILSIRGGILDGNPIGEADVQNLATLPPVEVLRGQVLGAITAPLMTVVGLISAPVRDLIGLIDARIEQLQAEGDTGEAPAAETPAEEPVGEVAPAETTEATEATEPTEEPVAAESSAEEAVGAESAEADPATDEAATEQPSAEEGAE